MSAPEISGIQKPQFRLPEKRGAHFRIRGSRFYWFDECPRNQSFLGCPMAVAVEATPHAGSQVGNQGKITIGGTGEPLQELLEPGTGGKHPISDSGLGVEVKTPVDKPGILAE